MLAIVAETAGPLIDQLVCSGQAVYTSNIYLNYVHYYVSNGLSRDEKLRLSGRFGCHA
jgi:hypothetical protein